jgi:hypothetical protein
MKQVVLHLGTGKTGSTAIQNFLRINSPALRNNKIIYVSKLEKFTDGQTDYAKYIRRSDPESYKLSIERLRFLFSVVDAEYRLIYSNELFYGNKKVLSAYRAAIGKIPFKVILYIRRQDEFMQAHYSQLVVGQDVREIKDFREIRFDPNYFELLKLYKEVFGKENLIVRRYDKDRFVENNLFADFSSAIDLTNWQSFKKPAKKDSNESRSRKFIELLKIANSKFPKEKHAWAIQMIEKHLKGDAYRNKSESYSFLSREEAALVMSRYERSNRLVANEWFGEGELFSVNGKSGPANYSVIDKSEIEKIFRDIFEIRI